MGSHRLARAGGYVVVIGSVLAPAAGGATVATFDGGNDTTNGGTATPAPDTFRGTAGGGWQAAWTTAGTIAGSVTNTTPVDGGGNYLVATSAGTTAAATGAWSRKYGGATDPAVSLGARHTISWTMRIDESAASLTSNFTNGADRYQAFGDATALSTTATSNEWLVGAFGADPATSTPGFVAKRWEFYNASATTNAFTSGALVDSGIALTSGATYRFTITTDPATKTYVGSVTDLANPGATFTSGTLNWRTASTNTTGLAGGVLEFGNSGNAAGETRAFSLDGVQVVPEPAAAGLLAGAVGIAAAGRRRRRR
ncbi:MAG: hypothetical protein JWO31_584 [Phycisphaerales bacterium]|nr:hypothetical protein [Phycisphaerales bacterium]